LKKARRFLIGEESDVFFVHLKKNDEKYLSLKSVTWVTI